MSELDGQTGPVIDAEALRQRLVDEPDLIAYLGAFAGRSYALGPNYFNGEVCEVYATPEGGVMLSTAVAAHTTKELFLIAANGWDSKRIDTLSPEKVSELIDGMNAADEVSGVNVHPNLRVLASERAIFGYHTPLQSMHRWGDV